MVVTVVLILANFLVLLHLKPGVHEKKKHVIAALMYRAFYQYLNDKIKQCTHLCLIALHQITGFENAIK